MTRQPQAYSIFGQIEEVAAEIMVERGLARRIEYRDIPTEMQRNEAGTPARFAIWIFDPKHSTAVFENLIADLRA